MPKTYAKTSQQLTVPEHFYRQSGSSKWYIRLVAPKHIQPLLAQKEFRKSTGHSDLKRAKVIGHALITEKLREWDSLARSIGRSEKDPVPTALTGELVEYICSARLYSWMQSDDDERFSVEGLSTEALAEIDGFCKLSDAAMRSVLAQGPASSHWPDVVESTIDWCCVLDYQVETSDPMFPQLARAFARVEKEAQRLIGLRNDGEDTPPPPPPRPTSLLLSDITERFREYKAPKANTKHLGTMLNAWKLFVDFCGDIALDSVTPTLVFDFMEARMHASSKPWSEERAKTFGKRTLAEIFGFARTKGFMSKENPVDGLEAFPSLSADDEASRRNPRYPYSSKQLNTLLGSEWYDPTNISSFRGKMRDDLGARYWVPLIGIFHGTRVREVLQLVVSDFAMEANVYVMSIQADMQELGELRKLRSVKNESTRRRVPVHPQLVALGLIEFIEARRLKSGDSALLFPSSMPEPGGKSPKLGRAYEQAFLRFVRDYLGFGHGFGNHSLRHQLEDRVRDAQARKGVWPAGLGQQFTGRKRTRAIDRDILLDEGSEGEYGDGYKFVAMQAYIAKIDFSDLSLPAPYTEWLKGPRQAE
jgi:integrase